MLNTRNELVSTCRQRKITYYVTNNRPDFNIRDLTQQDGTFEDGHQNLRADYGEHVSSEVAVVS